MMSWKIEPQECGLSLSILPYCIFIIGLRGSSSDEGAPIDEAEPGGICRQDVGQRPEGSADEVHLPRVRVPDRRQLRPAPVLAREGFRNRGGRLHSQGHDRQKKSLSSRPVPHVIREALAGACLVKASL